MDFEVARVEGVVTFLQRASETAEVNPGTWQARGEALEKTDKSKAEAAYRNALALVPDYVDAYLNLGALLCEMNRCDEAVQLYQDALSSCPASALLLFNHAIALEDQGRLHEAAASYERCLKVDPQLADAHFNLGRLQEQLGDARGALRHFSTYRRLRNL
jgi:tetratricopeptide (TPR) repeat protein